MNKYSIFKCLILSILFFCFISINTYGVENNKIILIDPGHGGIDGGAVSPANTLEKDLNLQISLKLQEVLKNKGYKVFMTRNEDICLSNNGSVKQRKREDLNKRCSMKKETGCDIFLSIHMNKFPDSSAKGSQVWYPIYSEKSKKLAEIMHKYFKESLKQQNNRQPKGVKNDYVVLRDNYSGISLIVECGFLSNNEDEKNLKDSVYQYELCNSIAMSIDEYFSGGNLN